MRKLLICTILAATTLYVCAQSKLDLGSMAQLRRSRMALKLPEIQRFSNVEYSQGVAKLKKNIGVPATNVFAVAKLADGYGEEDLREAGVNVIRCHLGFAFLSIPLDDVERVAGLSAIKAMQISREGKTCNNYAREATGINKIHQGIDLPQAYTGKDVICGIFDIGIDPNHINFKDAEGNLRVKYVSNIVLDQSTYQVSEKYYNTPETIAKFTTDDYTSYHGTHTMGTMAGGYMGTATIATPVNESTSDVTDSPCPFYGVAYDSDIVAICGTINDYVVALAVEELLGYADYAGKPMVINLSVGTQLGPHDGSSMLCQFFDACVEQYNAKICIAASNSGDTKIATDKHFTANDTVLRSFIEGMEYEVAKDSIIYVRNGILYAYSDNTEPFEIEAVLYNKSRGTIAKHFPFTITTDNEETPKYWVSSSYYQSYDTDIIDEDLFGKYMSGYVGLIWGYTENADRMYAVIDFLCIDNPIKNGNHNYTVGFVIKGKEGHSVYVYGDGEMSHFSDNGIEGWDDGKYDGSISDWCTAKNVLSVGSYNTSERWGGIDGLTYHADGYEFPTGEVSAFSSYGTLIDGRTLPDVLAPGAAIVSSMNRYYSPEEGGQAIQSAKVESGDAWAWQAGTSMATPHVAGAIALWLEANPNLTMAEIKDIIKETAVNDEYTASAPAAQVGAGKFDAYAGLKEVIRRLADGIDEIHANDSRTVLTPLGNRSFKVFIAGSDAIRTTLYNMSGQPVMSITAKGEEMVVNASSLPKGCYIVDVNGNRSKCMLY